MLVISWENPCPLALGDNPAFGAKTKISWSPKAKDRKVPGVCFPLIS